jgi:hypothetical protein
MGFVKNTQIKHLSDLRMLHESLISSFFTHFYASNPARLEKKDAGCLIWASACYLRGPRGALHPRLGNGQQHLGVLRSPSELHDQQEHIPTSTTKFLILLATQLVQRF